MEGVMEQQLHPQGSNKYYCRICKKGFACGRALGGHMRAHGINDDGAADEDAEPPATYELRSNPNRFKTCRACDNCGKDFSSWKSFLEHGRCGGAGASVEGEVDGSMLSLSRSDGVAADTGGCAGWSKGKRSKRTAVVDGPSSEDDDLAASCLVMLSAARMDPVAVTETEESCASASKEEDEDSKKHSSERMAANPAVVVDMPTTSDKQVPSTSRGLFECKACKRVFTSHQALGGHRASHKKVKGCFAAKLDVDVDDNPLMEEEPTTTNNAERMAVVPFDNAPMAVAPLRKRGKLHECTICHRVFTSGQALGGHKRCHWLTGNSSAASAVGTSAVAKLQATTSHDLVQHQRLLQLGSFMDVKTGPSIDLNILPMPTTTASGAAVGNLRLELPSLCYQDYMNTNVDSNNTNIINVKKCNDDTKSKNNKEDDCSVDHLREDEGGRNKAKVARLSELKDAGVGGENSKWLQVGLGPCTDGSAADT